MTFKTPFPSALIMFLLLRSIVMPVIVPLKTRSSAVSSAKYGFIADAPNPIRVATWWTSLASPASMTSPAIILVPLRIRWWCTAEQDSSEGIGASSLFESRSDSTIKVAPTKRAWSTSAQIDSSRASRASGPSSTRYRQEMVTALPMLLARSMCLIFANSSLPMIG